MLCTAERSLRLGLPHGHAAVVDEREIAHAPGELSHRPVSDKLRALVGLKLRAWLLSNMRICRILLCIHRRLQWKQKQLISPRYRTLSLDFSMRGHGYNCSRASRGT